MCAKFGTDRSSRDDETYVQRLQFYIDKVVWPNKHGSFVTIFNINLLFSVLSHF